MFQSSAAASRWVETRDAAERRRPHTTRSHTAQYSTARTAQYPPLAHHNKTHAHTARLDAHTGSIRLPRGHGNTRTSPATWPWHHTRTSANSTSFIASAHAPYVRRAPEAATTTHSCIHTQHIGDGGGDSSSDSSGYTHTHDPRDLPPPPRASSLQQTFSCFYRNASPLPPQHKHQRPSAACSSVSPPCLQSPFPDTRAQVDLA